MIKVDMDDLKKQIADSIKEFQKYNIEVHSECGKAVLKGALKVEGDAKRLFKGKNEDSVPGEPPRVQTGRARSSISHRMVDDTSADVGSNVEYVKYLDPTPEIEAEFGTSKRPKHPFLTRALAENQETIKQWIKEAMIKSADNVTR